MPDPAHGVCKLQGLVGNHFLTGIRTPSTWELMHCEADCAQHGQLFKQRKMTPLTDF